MVVLFFYWLGCKTLNLLNELVVRFWSRQLLCQFIIIPRVLPFIVFVIIMELACFILYCNVIVFLLFVIATVSLVSFLYAFHLYYIRIYILFVCYVLLSDMHS